MNGAFYIGATGLDAQQRALDIVAHNIANLNTTGFKRSVVRFSELAAPQRTQEDDPVAQTTRPGGVAMTGSQRVWVTGDLRRTGGELDLAIDGRGFVELLGPAGRTLLWRGGSLKTNDDGALATADGVPLKASMVVPREATALTIARDGTITAVTGANGEREEIGRLDLVVVADPDTLVESGQGYYQAPENARLYSTIPGEDGAGVLVQGSIEQANVALSDEMVTLLLLQRSYAASAQVVQAGDQLMSIANNLRG
jgi:flagellar basal-body rod protein FlgG